MPGAWHINHRLDDESCVGGDVRGNASISKMRPFCFILTAPTITNHCIKTSSTAIRLSSALCMAKRQRRIKMVFGAYPGLGPSPRQAAPFQHGRLGEGLFQVESVSAEGQAGVADPVQEALAAADPPRGSRHRRSCRTSPITATVSSPANQRTQLGVLESAAISPCKDSPRGHRRLGNRVTQPKLDCEQA